jgi:ectoine hydroxylase-related dioxygenase (phytanoyl-CoA dioxygenase family)
MQRHGVGAIDLGASGLDLCDQAVRQTDGLFRSGVNRIQDAWRRAPAVRALALHPEVRRLLDTAFGRASFPFQTLNFLRGSQQDLHSDSIHFSAAPERFMCGVWIALEDVELDAGPLVYLAGSHTLPILTMQDYGTYTAVLATRLANAGFEEKPAVLPKGHALVWAANLVHGGAPIARVDSTRRSLVVHFYFDDCAYYTPMFSNLDQGVRKLRTPPDIRTGLLRWPTVGLKQRARLMASAARVLKDNLFKRYYAFD